MSYTLAQILKLYRKLAEELKETLGAEETENTIKRISEKYRFSDEQVSKFVDLLRDVLMGLLSPDEFQETLEIELKLDSEMAKKVAFQINRYVFRPVKESLRLLSTICNTRSIKAPISLNRPPSQN